MDNNIIEFDVNKVISFEEEEKDYSVNYYVPFCLCLEDKNKKQLQIYMDYNNLLEIAKLLNPYLESFKEREKADNEYITDLKEVTK